MIIQVVFISLLFTPKLLKNNRTFMVYFPLFHYKPQLFMSSSPSRTSSSGNIVHIKLKDKKNGTAKKALIPSSITALKKTSTKLFGLEAKPVQSVYTEEGVQITSISEVIPGMTVYVSSELTDADSSFFEIGQNNTFESLSNEERISLAGNQSPGFEASSHSLSAKKVPLPPTHNQPVFSPRSPSPKIHAPSSGTHTPSALAVISQSQPEMVINKNPSPRPGSPPRSSRQTSPRIVESEDEYDIDTLDVIAEEREVENRKQIQVCASVRELLTKSAPGVISTEEQTNEDLLNTVPTHLQRFSSSALGIEKDQQKIILNNLRSIIGDIPPHTTSIDIAAKTLLDQMTQTNVIGSCGNYRTSIVGPRMSGKSTFLKVFSQHAFVRSLISGQYKSEMFMYLDFLMIEKKFSNPLDLYSIIIISFFDQICSQRLDLSQFNDVLKSYFLNLFDKDQVVPIPQKFAHYPDYRQTAISLHGIAVQLHTIYHKTPSLQAFLTNIVTLPHYLSRSFGYSQVHFLIDHFDLSDIEIICPPGFPNDISKIPLIEFFKLMLSYDSFVISCIDEIRFLESVDLIDNDSIDFLRFSDIYSIIGIDNSEDHQNDIEFVIKLQDEKRPLILRCIDCCGCSGFLSIWDSMIGLAQMMLLEPNKNSRKYMEIKLSLLSKMRSLVPLVFNDSNHPVQRIVLDFEIRQVQKE